MVHNKVVDLSSARVAPCDAVLLNRFGWMLRGSLGVMWGKWGSWRRCLRNSISGGELVGLESSEESFLCREDVY